MHVKLTKSWVESLPLIKHGAKAAQIIYRDTDQKGFGLIVGTTAKTYFAEGKVKGTGRACRIAIAEHPVISADAARVKAKKYLEHMADGINPVQLRRDRRAKHEREQQEKAITLQKAFHDYKAANPELKPRTVYDYDRIMKTYFASWNAKPIIEITRDIVERKYIDLGKKSRAQANLSMRFLRALCYFASAKYEDGSGERLLKENPVTRVFDSRQWFKIERRRTYIAEHDLAKWFDAVLALTEEEPSEVLRDDHGQYSEGTAPANSRADVVQDYLLFLLLTGLRRSEAARLTWADADLRARKFTALDTKNKEPHTLPLSDYLLNLLARRKGRAENQYIFPGPGKRGYLVEPKKQLKKVIASSKVDFTLHDLRRTFTTIAERLDIPAYALKRLLNHKMTNDVTAGYIMTDVERLRDPMQKITDYMLRAAGQKKSADVLEIASAKATRT